MKAKSNDHLVKNRIRVLVADGSAFDGMQLAKALDEGNGIEVVGRAKDGRETLHMVEDLRPDVITLDSDMPGIDGTAVLERIMVRHSAPILMVCSRNHVQSRMAFDALRNGAVDVISKPPFGGVGSLEAWKEAVITKVKRAARVGRTVVQGTSDSQDPSVPREVPDTGNADLGVPDFMTAGWLMNRSEEEEEETVGCEISACDGSTARDERGCFCGYVERVDIIEFLQFALLTGKPMVLELYSNSGEQGRIFLRNGTVLHAICGNLEGERALYKCLAFQGGRFSNRPWRDPGRKSIRKPGELLLVEAARRRDEGFQPAEMLQEPSSDNAFI